MIEADIGQIETPNSLLAQVLERLRADTGFEITQTGKRTLVAPNFEADALIKVRAGKLEWPFCVSILRNPSTQAIDLIISREIQKTLGGPLILAADRISPAVASRLRRNGIGFADPHGNSYLPMGIDLRQFATGNTARSKEPKKGRLAPVIATSIGRNTFVRLLFSLLQERNALNASLHQMANTAGISVGSAYSAINHLNHAGFIAQSPDHKRMLLRREELVRKWQEQYVEYLRPKLILGRYRLHEARGPNWWRDIPLTVPTAQWSGEAAADLLTHQLKPSGFVIHVDKDMLPSLISRLKLIPSPEGKVEVLERFWSFEFPGFDRQIAPPLAVYGDLIATGHPRSVSFAAKIYEDYLARP